MSSFGKGNKRSFGEILSNFWRAMFSCCGTPDEDDERAYETRGLQISGPTNFRREDVSIQGLTEEEQNFVRQKAQNDAERMFAGLQPLRSSPSGQFAERPMPSFEQFTQPRAPPTPPHTRDSMHSCHSHPHSHSQSGVSRLIAHGRKISDSWKKPGYVAVSHNSHPRKGSPVEMRTLMDPSKTQVSSTVSGYRKMSEESFSQTTEDSRGRDRDSGKAGFDVSMKLSPIP